MHAVVRRNVEHLERDQAVIDVNQLAGRHDLGQVLVVDVQGLEIAVALTRRVGRDVEAVALLESDLPSTIAIAISSDDVDVDFGSIEVYLLVALEQTGADLGSLGIESDGDHGARNSGLGGAGVVDHRLMVLQSS